MKIKNYFLTLALLTSCFAFAQTGTIDSTSFTCMGKIRTYTYYVPKIYDSIHAVPLIINMHGATGTSAKQQVAEDFRKIADTANFIVVHPQGLNIPIYPGIPIKQNGWNVLGTVAAWDTDKVFILNLLDTMLTNYKINPSRIYLTGYSEGGFMSYDFACFVTSRFAAIASVSGSLVSSHFSACAPSQSIPVMEIHGTNDGTIGYTGAGLTTTTPVDNMIKYWVNKNNCSCVPDSIVHLPDLVDSATVDKSKVIHYIYQGAKRGDRVELYKVLNGGHQIPSAPPVPTSYGNGNTNEDFTAAKEIWRFFNRYNLDSLGVIFPNGTEGGGCMSTGIANNKSAEDKTISIYPNPSNGKFTLYVEGVENTTVQVINLLGAVVFETKVSEQYTKIDLSTDAKGIYFYKVSSAAGVVKSGKVIIE
jgi:polyhydroxybutyrate depolymerase